MISEREALKIAQEYIRNDTLLKQSWYARMGFNSRHPKAWVFTIHHKNEDNDTFRTVIEVTNNGIVSDWETRYISDEV